MKRYFLCFLCLMLALLPPFGCAAAEPARWLDPWIAATGNSPRSMRGICSFEIDSAALDDLLTPLFDAAASPTGTMLDTTEEEAAALQEQTLRAVALVRQMFDTYLGAAAALANQTTIQIEGAGQDCRYTFFLGQEKVMEFTLLRPAEGPTLLLSDLYPSYALELTEEIPDLPAGSSDMLLLADSAALPEAAEEGEAVLEMLAAALPDYADYHFLAGMVDAARLELEALAEQGLAAAEGDTLRYSGTLEALEKALEEMELPYDPLYRRMINALNAQEADGEEAQAAASEEELPRTLVYEITGDEVLEETVRVHSYTAYDEEIDPETGSVSRIARPAQWEEKSTLRYSPNRLTLEENQGPDSRIALRLDASQADAIDCLITIVEKGTENQLALGLSRTEEGQALDCSWHGADGGSLVLPLNDSDTETVALPPLRCTLQIANDCSQRLPAWNPRQPLPRRPGGKLAHLFPHFL